MIAICKLDSSGSDDDDAAGRLQYSCREVRRSLASRGARVCRVRARRSFGRPSPASSPRQAQQVPAPGLSAKRERGENV